MYSKGTFTLSIFVDSDFAEDTSDRKSTTGYLIRLGNSAIHWGAKKQVSNALTTCEAEYLAISMASLEVVHLRNVLKEAGFEQSNATMLKSDNQFSITWTMGDKKQSKRAKHIDVRVHHVRTLVANNVLNIVRTSSADNDADFLTKPLGKIRIKLIIDRIYLKSTL